MRESVAYKYEFCVESELDMLRIQWIGNISNKFSSLLHMYSQNFPFNNFFFCCCCCCCHIKHESRCKINKKTRFLDLFSRYCCWHRQLLQNIIIICTPKFFSFLLLFFSRKSKIFSDAKVHSLIMGSLFVLWGTRKIIFS